MQARRSSRRSRQSQRCAGTSRRASERLAETEHGVDNCLNDRVLHLVRSKLTLLLRIREVAHFDEDSRHIRGFEDQKRRTIYGARRKRHATTDLTLENLREGRRPIDMARLRKIPQDELDVTRPAAKRRYPLGPERRARRLFGALLERGIQDRRARRSGSKRSIGVEADEEIGLVVIG